MNLKTTPDALKHYTDEKNVKMLARHGICTATELESREEILLEEYCKTINIEALTMVDMATRQIMPACVDYSGKVSNNVAVKKSIGIDSPAEIQIAKQITDDMANMLNAINDLKQAVNTAPENIAILERAEYFRDTVIPKMENLRAIADELETIVGEDNWPFPTYGQMLFYV